MCEDTRERQNIRYAAFRAARRCAAALAALMLLSAFVAGAAFAEERGEIWLDISKGEHELRVMSGGETLARFAVAVGKNRGQKRRVGDMRTPEGVFYAVRVQDASSWSHDFCDGKGAVAGAYGPYFVRLKTGWQGIGIHGTHDPASIGTDATEGCVRLTNGDLTLLVREYIKPGTRVVIRP